jgi:hypothetical protein
MSLPRSLKELSKSYMAESTLCAIYHRFFGAYSMESLKMEKVCNITGFFKGFVINFLIVAVKA